MPATRVILLLALAALGPAVFSVAVMGVGPRGSFAATGAVQGYILGLGWATLLGSVASYRSRLSMGGVGLAATFLSSSYLLRHTSGIAGSDAVMATAFAVVEALVVLLFLLWEGRQGSCPVGWSWSRLVTRLVPLLPVLMLSFLRDYVSLTVVGAMLGSLLAVAIAASVVDST